MIRFVRFTDARNYIRNLIKSGHRNLGHCYCVETGTIITINDVTNDRISVRWTGSSSCMCTGNWEMTIDGDAVKVPFEGPAGTRKKYRRFRSSLSGDPVCTWYFDGMRCKDWCKENWGFLQPLCEKYKVKPSEIYAAFKMQDWRYHSCGECFIV